MLAIRCDRFVSLPGLLQLHCQVAIRVLVIRIQFDLLAECGDCFNMIVGSGVCQPEVVPTVLQARVTVDRALQQVNRAVIILALQRFHSRLVELLGSAFHLRSRLRPLPRRCQDGA